jgi:hypothetical protein
MPKKIYWSKLDHLLGTVPDRDICRRAKISESTVYRRRQKLGIPAFSAAGRPSEIDGADTVLTIPHSAREWVETHYPKGDGRTAAILADLRSWATITEKGFSRAREKLTRGEARVVLDLLKEQDCRDEKWLEPGTLAELLDGPDPEEVCYKWKVQPVPVKKKLATLTEIEVVGLLSWVEMMNARRANRDLWKTQLKEFAE